MLTVRDAIPKARESATAEFATLRLRLLKIAARVVETTSRSMCLTTRQSPVFRIYIERRIRLRCSLRAFFRTSRLRQSDAARDKRTQARDD